MEVIVANRRLFCWCRPGPVLTIQKANTVTDIIGSWQQLGLEEIGVTVPDPGLMKTARIIQ